MTGFAWAMLARQHARADTTYRLRRCTAFVKRLRFAIALALVPAWLIGVLIASPLSGLSKNLRRGDDGRYRWHWDPAFMGAGGRRDLALVRAEVADLDALARQLALPTLLVRGRTSDLLSQQGAQHFLELVPHARFADVSGAGHMVAGDRNDAFTLAVLEFLRDFGAGRKSA